MRPLAITGLGVVGPLGVGRHAWAASLSGGDASVFGPSESVLDAQKFPEARVAEARGFDAKQYLGDKGLRNFDRLTKFLIVAAKFALEDAGVKKDGEFIALGPEQVGICSSTAYGSLEAITELKLVAELEDPRYLNPARFPNTVINAAAGYVSIWEDLRAPNVTIVNGNCGALDGFLTCDTHLAHGRADAFLVGGGEVLSEALYLAFRKLGVVALGDAVFVPGSAASQGTHIGEGAAFVLVERSDQAEARGAQVLARVRGYGTAFEAPTSEAILVHASSDAVARAIAGAIADAGVSPSDVDVVCAAAGGIGAFDAAELAGIRAAVGSKVAVVAPKALYGEAFGAAGALAIATTLSWFEGAEPRVLIQDKAEGAPKTVVVTTVGYYGNVSAVLLTRD